MYYFFEYNKEHCHFSLSKNTNKCNICEFEKNNVTFVEFEQKM